VRFNVAALAHLVAVQLQVATTDVTPDARFVDDLGAEPIHIVDMILALEEHFEIDIASSDAGELRTLRDVLEYLARRGYTAEP